jgi:hypothetical protein
LLAAAALTHTSAVDGCLWTTVALCTAVALSGRGSRLAPLSMLLGGTGTLLGLLALVSPTP